MPEVLDLSKIPAPSVVKQLSMAAELDRLLNIYTLMMRNAVADPDFPIPVPADPVYQCLSAIAYEVVLSRQEVNEACHATMLAYAVGTDLDQIGATEGVERIVLVGADNSTSPVTPAVVEDDERFRHRIQISREARTTAGSIGSYEYAVLSCDGNIIDVFVDRPTFKRLPLPTGLPSNAIILVPDYAARLDDPRPGDVVVTILTNDEISQANAKAKAAIALDNEAVIPLTDTVKFCEPEIIPYSLQAKMFFYPGPSPTPLIASATERLAKYVAKNYRLGRDITVSGLHAAAYIEGVQRVELSLLQDIKVMQWQAAKCTGITVTNAGVDE